MSQVPMDLPGYVSQPQPGAAPSPAVTTSQSPPSALSGVQGHPVTRQAPPRAQDTEERIQQVQTQIPKPPLMSRLKAKFMHFKDALESKRHYDWACKELGKEIILGKSRNVARQEVIASEADFEAADALLSEFKRLKENRQDRFKQLDVCFDSDATPAKAMSDGICAGIRVDIAERYLVKRELVKSIVTDNREGASAEAAANHAIYRFLREDLNVDRFVADHVVQLKAIVLNHDLDPPMDKTFLNDYLTENTLNYTPEDGLRRYANRAKERVATEGERQAIDNAVEFILSVKQFCSTTNEIFRQQREGADHAPQFPQGLLGKIMRGMAEVFGIGKRRLPGREDFVKDITNPLHKAMIAGVFEHRDIQENVVLQARGLKQEMVHAKMGHHSLNPSDKAYLANLGNLDPGFYAIDFKVGVQGGHAISYIKEDASGKGYILDPNGIQVECQDTAHAQEILLKIINTYPAPKTIHPNHQQGEPYHRIDIKKIVRGPYLFE